jgi:hypothetical protein
MDAGAGGITAHWKDGTDLDSFLLSGRCADRRCGNQDSAKQSEDMPKFHLIELRKHSRRKHSRGSPDFRAMTHPGSYPALVVVDRPDQHRMEISQGQVAAAAMVAGHLMASIS